MTNQEQLRLSALHSYQVLDTLEEKDFDDLTALAAAICGVPIALISLVDETRQWFKSHKGLSVSQTPIEQSFCAYAIVSTDEITTVPDAREDKRFKSNPLVTGFPNIVFYAGVPLTNEEGFSLGTLCVIDSKEKKLTPEQESALKIVARQVMDKLELKRKVMALEAANNALQQSHITIGRLNESLQFSNVRTRTLIEQAPVAIIVFRGEEMLIEAVNPPMLALLNKENDIAGKPLLQAIPELAGQPAYEILYNIYKTGQPVYGYDTPVVLNRNGKEETGYFNFSYSPLIEDGKITGIIDMAVEVTEQVKAKLVVQQLNNELTEKNTDLTALNEEMAATNEELLETQRALQTTISELETSRARFSNMIHTSSVAMLVTRGDDLVFEEINQSMLDIIGKDISVKGKPWFSAIPELVGQPIMGVLYNTYHTGEECKRQEEPIVINRDGKPYHGYFNLSYRALKENGVINGVLQSAVDVTEQVLDRKKIEMAEEMLRFSTEAANAGTWFFDTRTHQLVSSARLKQLFGFHADDEVTFEAIIAQIPDGYADIVRSAMEATFATGNDYHVEHPVIGFHDKERRWLKSMGKLYPDSNGEQTRFSGLLIDITEQKHDEQRKSDFIGMVSHEMKTPLTTISAYSQVLQMQAAKSNDTFAIAMLDKVNKQVSRMTILINGFLNVSRFESGNIHIDKTRFDMAELVKESEEESAAIITSHKVVFAPVESTFVMADRDKIGQVINNLLSNAVKYSPAKTTIHVTCIMVDNMALVSVKDEGMGIQQKDIDKLFERYYRVEESKGIAGFGIGLYLSAEIIKRHDGRIWVESEVGKGSVFSFVIPVVQ